MTTPSPTAASSTERRRADPTSAAPASRYFDSRLGRQVVKVLPGKHHVTRDPDEVVATTLGSCVSACVRDPAIGVGGLNHFMLPGDPKSLDWSHPNMEMRYGQNAMERLINDILREGGRRERLEIKVFGGGNVMGRNLDVGDRNVAFVRAYLAEEGFRIAAEDLGGDWPRRILYDPQTGKVDRLLLRRDADRAVVDEEAAHRSVLRQKGVQAGSIELFE